MGFTFKNTRSNSSQAAGGRSFRKRSVTSLANEREFLKFELNFVKEIFF